jgi:PAS domain S-box-containing protein
MSFLKSPINSADAQRLSSLWRRAALFSLAYFLSAWLGSYLSVRNSTSVSFWLPAGLYVAVLLLNERRDWWWFVLAAFPANLVFDLMRGTSLIPILFFYMANTVQSITGAWLVKRFVSERPTLATLKEFIGLVFFSAVLSTMLGAAIGAATLVACGFSHSFLQSWKVWWGSCAMAILIFSPFLLTWFSRPGAARRCFESPQKILEAGLLFFGLGVYMWYLLAWDNGVLSYHRAWAIPFLLWAGLRFGARGATAASLFISFTMAFFTTQYFYGLTPQQILSGEYVLIMQSVLAMTSLAALIPAIVLGERDRSLAKLRDSENRYRSLTEAAFEGVSISENGIILDMNDQGLKMFGYSRDEMVGMEISELIAPESRAKVAEAIRTGQELIYGHQIRRKDGTCFYAEAQARMVQVGDRKLRMTALRDITERLRAEQALRESEEKFSKAFRASPDVMSIVDLETGQYLEVNEAHEKIYGFQRAEVIGRSPIELGILVDPAAREKMLELLATTGSIRNLEIQARTRSGKLLTMLHSAEPINLGGRRCILRVTHDITEQKQAAQALNESEEKFSKAFRTSPDVMSIVDLETDQYLEVNEAHAKVFGFQRAEVIGRSPAELGIVAEPSLRKNMVTRLKAAGSVRDVEIQSRNRGGETLMMLHSAEIIQLGGRQCILGVSHDITGRKRAEAQREQAVAREQQARIEYTLQLISAQEAERTRIARELHDSLGQNLLLIKNHAQLALMQEMLSVGLLEQLNLISGLASQSIAEARQISYDLHPHQLDHLGLTRAVELLADNAAQASGIAFDRRLEMVDDLFPGAAAVNFYRIVQESLNNVLKHSRAQNVRLRLERDVQEVQLEIKDDGCGFDPGPARDGLGLKNIAARVRMLGGRFKLDSKPSQGSRLEVTIPFTPPE